MLHAQLDVLFLFFSQVQAQSFNVFFWVGIK